MNDYLLSVILGIVEGVTEFLPISSTAHLRISEALLNIKLDSEYWKMYSVVIQLGAILSLFVYFRRRLIKFISTFPHGEKGNRTLLTHPLSLTFIAFVVTAIPSFLLSKLIGKHLEDLSIMGASLLIGGAIMWAVDVIFVNPKTTHMEDMNIFQSIWIGAMQIFSAVFPGTSRSMSTIAAGQTAGMSRASALEFSFFLSIPTMVAATGYEFLKTVGLRHSSDAPAAAPIHMNAHAWIVLTIGFAVSFIVALAVVAWFMHWVRNRGFVPFAFYRIALGLIVLRWASHIDPAQMKTLLIVASLCWIPAILTTLRNARFATPIAILGLVSLLYWPLLILATLAALFSPRSRHDRNLATPLSSFQPGSLR